MTKQTKQGSSQKQRNKAQNMKKAYVHEQPRKDSSSKRVNCDNMREDKVKDMIERDSKGKGRNDISWYTKNPELIRSAASIPFSSVLGDTNVNVASTTPTAAVYGIMALPWAPCVGTDDIAVNQTFNSQYSYIVHANSRNYAYNAPDLGIMELAAMNVFSIIGTMIRAFGIVRHYEQRNYYLPDGLLMATGFIPKDIRENRSKMWFDLNNLIDQTRQIWVPNTMPLADRWYELNSNVYTDSDDASISQLYVFVQDAYYIYSETGLKTGSSLLLVNDDGEAYDYDEVATATLSYSVVGFNPARRQYKWSQWLTIAQAMIDALVNSEDRGIIFGDILNAYGTDSIRALQPVDAAYTVQPVYNAEILTQIENWVESPAVLKGIGQTDGTLKLASIWSTKPIFYYSQIPGEQPAMPDKMLLNFHTNSQPTPEMVTVATRFGALGFQAKGGRMTIKLSTNSVNSGIVLLPDTCGTEIPHAIVLYHYAAVSSTDSTMLITADPMTQYSPNVSGNIISQRMGPVMSFDWHPFFYTMSGTKTIPTTLVISGYSGSVISTYGDHANYDYINESNIAQLHRVCLYSLLGIPQI